MRTSALAQLPAPERVYVETLLSTGSKTVAREVSGIPSSEIFNSSVAQRAMLERLQAQLLGAAPMAIKVLESLMTDPDVPAAVRRLAASDILDRIGLVSQASMALSKPLESLSEMPARDLRQLVERLETELFARAKPVRDLEFQPPDGTPVAAKPSSVLD